MPLQLPKKLQTGDAFLSPIEKGVEKLKYRWSLCKPHSGLQNVDKAKTKATVVFPMSDRSELERILGSEMGYLPIEDGGDILLVKSEEAGLHICSRNPKLSTERGKEPDLQAQFNSRNLRSLNRLDATSLTDWIEVPEVTDDYIRISPPNSEQRKRPIRQFKRSSTSGFTRSAAEPIAVPPTPAAPKAPESFEEKKAYVRFVIPGRLNEKIEADVEKVIAAFKSF